MGQAVRVLGAHLGLAFLDIRGVHGHADHVIACIHMQVLAGDTRGQIRQEIQRGFAHVIGGHIAAQGELYSPHFMM